ncbi:macrolide-specific efflux system membrane fusion protein [Rhizobium sp. PP-F2F-G38]|nr:macrolide-specific efflux system membrane fusion protein [Rhizobium sp. PP-WC-1G-195]PYE98851.1 macrolide-specific efflux system membrane fusion protein [Rhizobium sp. PP-F2F-G38]
MAEAYPKIVEPRSPESLPQGQPEKTPPHAPTAKAKPRRRKGRVFLLAGLLAILGIGGWYGWKTYNAAGVTQAVVTEAVARGDIENSVTASGLLSPIRDVDVGAQVSGQLKSLKVDVGDMVTQGQLIAEIDSASIETQIEIADAELANLDAQMTDKKAQVVLAAANLTRQRSLVAGNSAAQSALDEAVAAVATAEANVAALEAQVRKQQATLKDARISLGYTKIYAPLAGTIVEVVAKEGQTLNANQSAPTIVTVADLDTMTVEAEVSEADIGKLSIGMEAYFTLLGQPGERYAGTLRQIKPTPSTENNVVLYYALFDVPNPDRRLMMNMTAQVFFVQSRATEVLTIPVAALRQREGGKRSEVAVVSGDGSQEVRTVEPGIRNRVRVEIRSGLSEGDKVVVGSGTDGRASNAQRATTRTRGGPPPMF